MLLQLTHRTSRRRHKHARLEDVPEIKAGLSDNGRPLRKSEIMESSNIGRYNITDIISQVLSAFPTDIRQTVVALEQETRNEK